MDFMILLFAGLNPAQKISILTVVVCAMISALVLVLVRRRHRHQIQTLLARLEELESQGSLVPPTPFPAGSPAPKAEDSVSLFGPGLDDPLAGKTSDVRRIVEGDEPGRSLANQAILCVHQHLEDNLKPHELAAELFISLRTLERGLAASLDCSPSQLIMAMKLRNAKRLLKSGDYRVGEVAYQLGFSSPGHFSRRFKTFYGCSPSELLRKESSKLKESA